MIISSYIKHNWSTPQGYKQLLRVALPLMAGMASTTAMQFIDRIFLSHHSVEEIAAAFPASITAMTLTMTMIGICGYTSVLCAQYIGAGNKKEAGAAMWQGVWCAVFCSAILFIASFFADSIFKLVGHEAKVQELEVIYFRYITAGSSLAVVTAAIAGFFYGRGITRPIMYANILAAVLKIPLDYAFILGHFGMPALGIRGAGMTSCIAWGAALLLITCLVFSKKNRREYEILKSWRLRPQLLKKLIHYGLPSGVNFFVEFAATSWFIFQVGAIGTIPLAASNIAFSINTLAFTPAIGMNMATAVLVGQSMGANEPLKAETITKHALHITMFYMISVAIVIVLFAGNLIDIFQTEGAEYQESFAAVKVTGITLLYYVALYSVVDAANLVYFGALKGAGDTVGIMKIVIICIVLVLLLPIAVIRYLDIVTIHTLWMAFTAYIFVLAGSVFIRYRHRKWHFIKMVEK